MPRIARIIVPNVPHHIVQRGNRNQQVFFSDEDKKHYLKILGFNCSKEKVKIWCYCLMNNHVHLIVVPESAEGLIKAISETHRRYTWIINARNNWKGYLWQGRFRSYPMDEAYLYACTKYVERNPVRAGLARRAEQYRWSSARAHVFGYNDPLLSPMPLTSQIKDWRSYLQGEDKEEDLERLRKNQANGYPLGSDDFIEAIEKTTGIIINRNSRKMGTRECVPH
ncbi:MAG: transposase [Candidatus Saccharicenans sp.]|nr:transposase [Candidatus Saccharicenans sp.]